METSIKAKSRRENGITVNSILVRYIMNVKLKDFRFTYKIA